MKTYFQIQSGRKMRVYQVVAGEGDNKKRQQKTIGVIGANDEKVPASILKALSPDDQLELQDRMRMLREQSEYEEVRKELKKLPEFLRKSSALLAGNRLTISSEQRTVLINEMSVFLKHLRPTEDGLQRRLDGVL